MTCLVWGEGGGEGGVGVVTGYVVYLIWPGLDHSPHTTVPCNYGVWWSNKQDDLTGQGTCVNTNINSNVGPSTVVEGAGQRTWAAQHTAWSGLVWAGLVWAGLGESPNFLSWLAAPASPVWRCDGVTVWPCQPDKYLNDQNLLRPLDGSQVLVLSSAELQPRRVHFSFIIFIRTS